MPSIPRSFCYLLECWFHKNSSSRVNATERVSSATYCITRESVAWNRRVQRVGLARHAFVLCLCLFFFLLQIFRRRAFDKGTRKDASRRGALRAHRGRQRHTGGECRVLSDGWLLSKAQRNNRRPRPPSLPRSCYPLWNGKGSSVGTSNSVLACLSRSIDHATNQPTNRFFPFVSITANAKPALCSLWL